MEDNSPYFYVENESSIDTINDLVNLNKKITVGSNDSALIPEKNTLINKRWAEHHETWLYIPDQIDPPVPVKLTPYSG